MPNARTKAPNKPPTIPPRSPPIEETIRAAAEDERRRSPTGFSFASIYSFTAATVLMARGQERQEILEALPRRPEGKSDEWNEGHNAAVTAVIRILAERSLVL